MNIYGREVPLLLLAQYASARHTEGYRRLKLHNEIMDEVGISYWNIDFRTAEQKEWVEKFEHWIEVFIARMGRQYPHVFERAEPPKEVFGIPVTVSTSWECKICGYHTLVREAPKGIPCWQAVWNFYEPFQNLAQKPKRGGLRKSYVRRVRKRSK